MHQARQAFSQSIKGLEHHHRLGTGATDPAPEPAIEGDQGGVAGPSRDWAGRPHHRYSGVGFPALDQGRFLTSERRSEWPSDHAAQSPSPVPWIASHTLELVTGMSMLVTPRWDRASTTALTKAAGEPTVADSPTPLQPSG